MRMFSWIAMTMVLFVSGGATCSHRQPSITYPPPPPVQFDQVPTLEQVTAVVNRTANVQQLSTNSATIEMLSEPSLPRLNATVNLQRDRDFRMRASLPILLGMGLDMGSNDQVFWFEVPTGISKTLYYANHDQYRQQLSRAILPVDPTWMMDAIGLVQIDPASVVAGPIRRQDGKLEIRMASSSSTGTYERVCYIEPQYGYVTDQFLFDPSGTVVAQSNATNHVYYEPQQVALPHTVEMNLIPAMGPPMRMRINVGQYTVNQLLSGDPNLFTMPQTASQAIDLTTLSGGSPLVTGAGSPTIGMPTQYTADAGGAYPTRGMTR